MKFFLHSTAKLAMAGAFALAVLTAGSKTEASATPATETDSLTVEQFKALGEEGYIYGLPLVMNYAIMNEYAVDKNTNQFKAPFNHIKNEPRVYTYKDTAVLSPNSDTPYSVAWLDLRAEPIVITVPEVEKGRYYSVQLIDGNLYNDGYIGSRATGNKAGSYAVVGPDWEDDTPEGVSKVFHSTTPFMLVIFRTQLFNPKDMPNVERIQAGYKVQTMPNSRASARACAAASAGLLRSADATSSFGSPCGPSKAGNSSSVGD